MDLQEVGFGGIGWIHVVQDRDRWWALVNAAMNHRVTKNVGNFLTGCNVRKTNKTKWKQYFSTS
jgi:hypothetical protein